MTTHGMLRVYSQKPKWIGLLYGLRVQLHIGTTVTAFLQSATNPENGTVNYKYSGNILATKTDVASMAKTFASRERGTVVL